MKKTMLVLGMLLIVMLAMSACRATQKCPAYGQNIYIESIENQG